MDRRQRTGETNYEGPEDLSRRRFQSHVDEEPSDCGMQVSDSRPATPHDGRSTGRAPGGGAHGGFLGGRAVRLCFLLGNPCLGKENEVQTPREIEDMISRPEVSDAARKCHWGS